MTFPPTSRYAAVETTAHFEPGGQTVRHLRRRFIAPADRFQTVAVHVAVEGERPDTLATRFLGDPEQWWRLADANAVARPEDLTDTPGRTVRVTLPEGMVAPGA